MTRQVRVGSLVMGGGARILVQSMTNTDTRDVEATLGQIRALAAAGCDIVRVSVYDKACAMAVRTLVDGSPVPLVADIHFDADLAVASVEQGIAKLRINPGNIGSAAAVRRVADCARTHGVPIRVGVNGGSLERDILARFGHPTPEALLESAMGHARLLEECGFEDIVLAVKTSDVAGTVAAYRLAAQSCDYPLHIGVTEAGLPEEGRMKSAVALGALLLDGIGDTIRVSLAGDPMEEPAAAKAIMRAAGVLRDQPEIIACPTCGRKCVDVAAIAGRVREGVADIRVPIKIAVMGCVVNGLGEAREADIGIAGGKGGGALFVKGEAAHTVHGDIAQVLIDEIHARWGEKNI